jgi:hypothetical protein
VIDFSTGGNISNLSSCVLTVAGSLARRPRSGNPTLPATAISIWSYGARPRRRDKHGPRIVGTEPMRWLKGS